MLYNNILQKINIYPEYLEEVEISPRDSLARDFEDGVEIKQEKGHNKEYVIKRPTRR